MLSVVWLINQVIQLYIYVLIIQVIMSWLIAFNVINTRNRFVYMIADVAYKLTEPALRPIRRILPNFGGIDLSPIVLILLLGFLQRLLVEISYRAMAGPEREPGQRSSRRDPIAAEGPAEGQTQPDR